MSTSQPDAIIRFGQVSRPCTHSWYSQTIRLAEDRSTTLGYEGVGHFSICDGKEIIVDRCPTASDESISQYLLGPVFSVLLHQRGLLVLHASSVLIGGQGVVFLAESGTGKSTLAAAFRKHGHIPLSDDVIAVDAFSAAGPVAYPGCPHSKLFPDTAKQLDLGAESMSASITVDGKSFWHTTPTGGGAVPLRRVYVLSDAENENAIALLGVQQAFVELVKHTFVAKLLEAKTAEFTRKETHFRQVSVLAGGAVKVKSLKRRRSFDALSVVVKLVEADMEIAA